jgi:hypothetical protein
MNVPARTTGRGVHLVMPVTVLDRHARVDYLWRKR